VGFRVRTLFLILVSLIVPACHHDVNPKKHPVIPAPPTGLTVLLQTTARIDLAWVDGAVDEIEFRIERSDDGGATYAQAGTVPANAVTYSDLGLVANTTYLYRVSAWNGAGSSAVDGPVTTSTRSLAWRSPSGGPGYRAEHSAVYDSLRQRMLLFAGYDDFLNLYADVWVLDLSHPTSDMTAPPAAFWSLLTTTADTPGDIPPERLAPAAVYDSTYDRMVVFGGQDFFGYENDVYVLDLAAPVPKWTKAGTTGSAPAGRLRHTAVFHPALQQMVVYGGNDAAAEMSDARFLSLPAAPPFAWSSTLPAGGPLPRTQHSSVYDAARGRMIVFGGLDNNILADGSVLSDETWSLSLGPSPAWIPWGPANPPSCRFGHTAVDDAANRRMVVFGGDTTTLPTCTKELRSLRLDSPGAWTTMLPDPGSAPVPRYGHSAVYDPVFGRMVVFGGNDDSGFALSDTWVIDF
jgi:hypothetical protein